MPAAGVPSAFRTRPATVAASPRFDIWTGRVTAAAMAWPARSTAPSMVIVRGTSGPNGFRSATNAMRRPGWSATLTARLASGRKLTISPAASLSCTLAGVTSSENRTATTRPALNCLPGSSSGLQPTTSALDICTTPSTVGRGSFTDDRVGVSVEPPVALRDTAYRARGSVAPFETVKPSAAPRSSIDVTRRAPSAPGTTTLMSAVAPGGALARGVSTSE